MQLRTKLSLVAFSLLSTSSMMAEDYVSVQYVQYDESNNRSSISSPSIELSKDFGVDYNVKVGITTDSVSGASPTWYDSTSGASAYSRDKNIHKDDVEWGNIKYSDDRVAVSALLTTRFASRDELSLGINYSTENDYEARELSAEYLHYLGESKNQSLSFGVSYQDNSVEVECIENSVCDASSGASSEESVNVISSELGFTQILDQYSLVKASIFYINEDGYLSNPYLNVVRSYDASSSIVDVVAESKPDTRVAFGATLQYAVALTSELSSNTTYRFYDDDWDIQSHTISTELNYQLNNEWLLGAGLRYYTQSEASFYKDGYFSDEEHASSDLRMRDFYGAGCKGSVDYRFSKALSMNLGLSFYNQQDNFDATYYNVGLKYRF